MFVRSSLRSYKSALLKRLRCVADGNVDSSESGTVTPLYNISYLIK